MWINGFKGSAMKVLVASSLFSITGYATAFSGLIDDRSSGDLEASTGGQWRLVTDGVMGGVSRGEIGATVRDGRSCLRMTGIVSTANNGGFVQMALDIPDGVLKNIDTYEGIEFQVAGNAELYNLHLRTSDLWLPWQSYRYEFKATKDWQTVRAPFAEFRAYRSKAPLRRDRLRRIGVVAIGRDFHADICVGFMRFYPTNDRGS